MNKASKTALGGLMIALSVVILIPTALEFFVYALPAAAALITMLAVIELNKSWAFGIYFGTSVISLLFVPNKEAAMLYAAFFGYYPIIKAVFESKLNRVLEYILKFLVFNAAMISAYFVLLKVFGIPYEQLMGTEGESGFFAKYAAPLLLLAGNLIFIPYDICLTRYASLYLKSWQKHFRRLFRFR